VSEPSFSRPADQRLNAIVFGRVQGVGFRFFVLQQAVRLGLSGWVRNTSEGMVEVVAEGDPASLGEMLTALQEGPDAAYVRDLKYHYSPATGEFRDFDIRYR